MKLSKTRITLLHATPKTTLIIDRFTKTMKLAVHHIDYAVSQLRVVLRQFVMIATKNIESAVLYASIRLPSSISHMDFDRSAIGSSFLSILAAGLKSKDVARDKLILLILQFLRPTHIDLDASKMNLHLGLPVFLGELSQMTLSSMSPETLMELCYEEI